MAASNKTATIFSISSDDLVDREYVFAVPNAKMRIPSVCRTTNIITTDTSPNKIKAFPRFNDSKRNSLPFVYFGMANLHIAACAACEDLKITLKEICLSYTWGKLP